ncbi:hypothetical protein P691DRAFT_441420 [Macrolepiota fuliginosa MF-IS2]|uniref:Uncharacterized protein n=1 Tax=Macrolepiota fuliginosa MF-IS2 TaxID=1400762 RepID=A0A9P5X3X0_9AGAR|nr:hypothetical protein P691DRAFT_441420 [Macrolepiota fuliginosa MF-IS2]
MLPLNERTKQERGRKRTRDIDPTPAAAVPATPDTQLRFHTRTRHWLRLAGSRKRRSCCPTITKQPKYCPRCLCLYQTSYFATLGPSLLLWVLQATHDSLVPFICHDIILVTPL